MYNISPINKYVTGKLKWFKWLSSSWLFLFAGLRVQTCSMYGVTTTISVHAPWYTYTQCTYKMYTERSTICL